MEDLSKLDEITQDAEQGANCRIFHPVSDEPLQGVVFRVVGRDSPTFRKAQRAQQTRRLKSRLTSLTPDLLEDEGCRLLARCTIGFPDGTILMDGEELPFSQDNAYRIYKRFPFIREQVDIFINDLTNFTKGLPETSSRP